VEAGLLERDACCEPTDARADDGDAEVGQARLQLILARPASDKPEPVRQCACARTTVGLEEEEAGMAVVAGAGA
jgi:hypothetical protein